MSRRARDGLRAAGLAAITLLAAACTVRPVGPPATVTATAAPQEVETSTPALVRPAVTSSATPTIDVAPYPTAQPDPVLVSAVNGNIFIRRGPDLAYNAVGVLRNGQTASAVARDVLSEWLEIQFPTDAKKTGWVTLVTPYTRVHGIIMSLPARLPNSWPEAASLRNCTHNEMVVYPGGITIPPVDEFPNNDVRLNPGVYKVYDSDVDGQPEVLTTDLVEGSEIDIRFDGNGEKKNCPIP